MAATWAAAPSHHPWARSRLVPTTRTSSQPKLLETCRACFSVPHHGTGVVTRCTASPGSRPSRKKRDSRERVSYMVQRFKVLPGGTVDGFVDLMLKHGEVGDLSDFNDLLAALVIAKESDIALRLHSNMSSFGYSPDFWTQSVMIECYCDKGRLGDARQLFDTMLQQRWLPSVAVCTTLISSFCRKGMMKDAFYVFDTMGGMGCDASIQTHNCLLKGLCYVGRVEEAYDWLERIKEGSASSVTVRPDIYTYAAVMDGFCKVGRTDEAMDILRDAVEAGLNPNVVVYNMLFDGYRREGRPLEGIGVLKRMKEGSCLPDCISYNTLIHGLLKWGEVRAAVRVYNEMAAEGFQVDDVIGCSLLRKVSQLSRKEKELLKVTCELFDSMRDGGVLAIDRKTVELVLRALCAGGRDDEALSSLQWMATVGYRPDMSSIEELMGLMCRQGKLKEALSVLCLVNEERWPPSGGAYNIMIDEFSSRRQHLGARNVYGAALKRGVLPDKKPGCG
ncbi:hypothetical protein MLD38_040204 [Melastoma candidum]|uniref:Uncharacterized protein n=1 Tax=Melastoma candidum TaxID=119954 RepID=A0ACB9L4L8_9MYRT|nr:hypothetical protein MLD38_040204 [Melastoma candidum]